MRAAHKNFQDDTPLNSLTADDRNIASISVKAVHENAINNLATSEASLSQTEDIKNETSITQSNPESIRIQNSNLPIKQDQNLSRELIITNNPETQIAELSRANLQKSETPKGAPKILSRTDTLRENPRKYPDLPKQSSEAHKQNSETSRDNFRPNSEPVRNGPSRTFNGDDNRRSARVRPPIDSHRDLSRDNRQFRDDRREREERGPSSLQDKEQHRRGTEYFSQRPQGRRDDVVYRDRVCCKLTIIGCRQKTT